MAMIGALLTGITMFFATTADARLKAQTIAEVDQQGAAALEYIGQTVRAAGSINSPAAGSSAASLNLAMPGTPSADPTVFSLSGSSALQVQEDGSSALPITNSRVEVTSLTFTNLTRSGTSGVVQISFVLSRKSASVRNEFSYQKTFTTSMAIRP
jgi:Tfp pilus assembly protein PilW